MRKILFLSFLIIISYSYVYSQVIHQEYTPQVENKYRAQLLSQHPFSPSMDTQRYVLSFKQKNLSDWLDKDLKLQMQSPVSLQVIPSIHARIGKDFLEEDYGLNSGIGIRTLINYKNKIAFDGVYRLHTFRLYGFEEDFLNQRNVLHGRGIPSNHHYSDFSFYVNWNANRYFNIESGFGKHFVGKGHRSLLLSNEGFNYPYLKITTNVWHFQYTNLWVKLKHIQDANLTHWEDFYDKYAAMHYLSWQIHPKFRIGFFEAIIWQGEDENGKRGFEINYLNPIIFYRPIEYDIGSPDNAIIGFDADFHVKNHLIYFQLMLDEFKIKELKAMNGWWANKQAVQLGWRYFNVLGVENLHSLIEFNYIRPFTYSHKRPGQNYGHYNQPLAHPLGANAVEGIFNLTYHQSRWFFECHNTFAKFGRENEGENYGGDIFLSYKTRTKEYDNFVGQGVKHLLFNHQLQVSYLINTSIHLNLFSRITLRRHQVEGTTTQHLFFELGLSNVFSGKGYRWKDY